MTSPKPAPTASSTRPSTSRRRFFAISASTVAAATLAPGQAVVAQAVPTTPLVAAAPPPPPGYQILNLDEAAFVEAMVNVMCPADEYTPNGVDCGIATYIDRQLAGSYGYDERLYSRGPWVSTLTVAEKGYQSPLNRQQFFCLGIAMAQKASQAQYGSGFDELDVAKANQFLTEIEKAKHDADDFLLSRWFSDFAYPLFVQGCFADPIYGGNANKVFWRMIGYPGLPATHYWDVVQFHGKAFPGAANPKSIQDFS